MKNNLILIYLILILSPLSMAGSETIIRVLPLRNLDYEIVNQFCRPMLSKGGGMGYLKNQRAIVVNDKKEVIAKITDFINQAGGKVKNIQITIDYAGSSQGKQQDFGLQGLKWEINTKPWKIRKPTVHGIYFSNNSYQSTSNTQMQLVTISGSAANLWVGKEVPEVRFIRDYILDPRVRLSRHGNLVRLNSVEFEMREVGAKLLIRPILQADGLIRVELFPEVSYYNKRGKRDCLQVESLKTTVTILPGQKISIGSVISGQKKGYLNLFGPDFFKNGEGQKILKMYVTARVL